MTRFGRKVAVAERGGRPGRPVDGGRGQPRLGAGRGARRSRRRGTASCGSSSTVPRRVAAHGRLRRGLPRRARRGRGRRRRSRACSRCSTCPTSAPASSRARWPCTSASRACSSSAAGLPVASGLAWHAWRCAGSAAAERARREVGDAPRREAVVARLGHRRRAARGGTRRSTRSPAPSRRSGRSTTSPSSSTSRAAAR